MSKIDTPYKQNLVNPKPWKKPDTKEKQQQRLVSTPEIDSQDLPFIDSRYEVLELVGSGGMGNVYKVSDRETGNIFAIKVLRSDLAVDQTSIKRFEQEVEATMGITHPNLVPTLAQGMTRDGAPYLVMEYVEGQDLHAVLESDGRLASNRVLNLLQQICEALVCAHEKGIIHRDIKPTNIILSKNADGSETARLVDFGIAKLLCAQNRETFNLTETGAVFGNPNYMSPEHCLSLKMDGRSDIYSLGCLIYELCTGNPPFAESNPVHVVVKHIHDDAKPFRAEFKTDAISEKLSDVALRCLEKDPNLRYQSIRDLVKDLELVSEGKRPAKYAKKRIARPEFTKTQILATVIGAFLLIQGRAMTGGWSDYLFIIMLLSAAGCLAFTCASIEQLTSIFKGYITPRNCWRAALFISFACLSWFSLPDNLYVLYAEHMSWMTPYTQIVALLAKLSVFSATIAAIGCAIFRSTIKIAVWKISLQFLGVMSAVVLMASAVLPKWTSDELAHACLLGRTVEAKAPWITNALLRYAIVLNPDNKSAVYTLALSLAKQDNVSEAAGTLDSYSIRETDKEALAKVHFVKSKIYKKDLNARSEELKTAIRLSPRFEYFEALGDLNCEMGRHEDALKAYDSAIRCQPGAVTPYCGKALVDASRGDYKTAIQELDRLARLEDTQISVFFLRGLLREKLHDASAKEDFQRIVQCDSEPKKRTQQGLSICEVKLRVAYAYKALHDNANFLLKLEEARKYGYGEFERHKEELERKCKLANLEL